MRESDRELIKALLDRRATERDLDAAAKRLKDLITVADKVYTLAGAEGLQVSLGVMVRTLLRKHVTEQEVTA